MGRTVELPCEIGEDVYFIPHYGGKSYCGVKKGHIQHITITKCGWRVKIREHQPHNMDFALNKNAFVGENAEVRAQELLANEKNRLDKNTSASH